MRLFTGMLTIKRCFQTTSRVRASWGFIGLGQMGYPMAKNLCAKLPDADRIMIYDIKQEVTKKFLETETASFPVGIVSKGARIEIADDVRHVANEAETIITVLPEPKHVKDVFKIILAMPKLSKLESGERLFVDCSTIDPVTSREVGKSVRESNAGVFVDAPMSGGVVGARAGTLTFMVGMPHGNKSLMERLDAVLPMMGKRVLLMGEQGAGLSAKLANNYLLAVSNIATAEAMNLGIRWGLDPRTLADLINSSSGRCWSSEVNNPVPGVVENAPASSDYDGGFAIRLMKKDLLLAMTAAKEAGARLELAEKARETYEKVEERYRGKDFSVVYRYLGGR